MNVKMCKMLAKAKRIMKENNVYFWQDIYCLKKHKQIDYQVAWKDYKNNKCHRIKENMEIVKCFKAAGFKVKRVREFTYDPFYYGGKTIQSVTYDIVKMEVA